MPQRREPRVGRTIVHHGNRVGKIEEITEDGWVAYGHPGGNRDWLRLEDIGGQDSGYWVAMDPEEEPAR